MNNVSIGIAYPVPCSFVYRYFDKRAFRDEYIDCIVDIMNSSCEEHYGYTTHGGAYEHHFVNEQIILDECTCASFMPTTTKDIEILEEEHYNEFSGICKHWHTLPCNQDVVQYYKTRGDDF